MKTRILLIVILITLFSLCESTLADIGKWKEFAPFYAARVQNLAKHPSGKIFASTFYDGLYVSDDHGNNWKQCYYYHSNSVIGSVTSVAIDSTGNIYINLEANGIKKSTDEGKTWVDCNFPTYNEGVFSITTDNVGNVFIGTRYGLYLSKDQGATWEKLLDTTWYSIVRRIYLKDGIIYALIDQVGIFKSKDYGITWTIIYLPQCHYNFSLLVINENEMYVSIASPPILDRISELMKTTDGGNSWQRLTTGLTTTFFHEVIKGKNNSIIATGILGRVFKSEDSGANWQMLTTGKTTGTITSIIMDAGRIIAGSDGGGVMISDDNGKTWSFSNNGFNASKIRTAEKLNDGTFLIANNAGLFHYDPTSKEFTGINNYNVESRPDIFGDLSTIEINGIIQLSDNSYMIATYQGSLFKSSDKGCNWQIVGMPYKPCAITLFEKTKTDKIYFNSLMDDKGLFQSDDRGVTWNRIQSNFGYCQSIAYDNQGSILTGNGVTLYRSSDEGTTWYQQRYFASDINSIKIAGNGKMYVLTKNNGLYQSTDKGVTWNNCLPEDKLRSGYSMMVPCNQLIETVYGSLLLATGMGLYESKDEGKNWKKIDDEFKDLNITKVTSSKDGQIYIMTGSGMFVSNYTITDVVQTEIPASFQLLQNYPNPFNPTTKIRFSLAERTIANLVIYDALGREISNLIDKELDAGYHEINFDGSKLSSGMYLYRLITPKFTSVGKMLLMK